MNTVAKNWRWIFMELTNRCNFDCVFCPSGISKRPRQDMDQYLAFSIIDQLQELGFCGRLYFHVLGEPLLHPDVFTIVDYAADAGVKPIIFTNGGALTDNAVISILHSKASELVISMQTINQLGYEKLRKTPFEWSTYLNRIQRALVKANNPEMNENRCTFRVSMGIKKTDTGHPEELYFLEYESLDQIKESIADIFGLVENIEFMEVFAQLDMYGPSRMPTVQITDRLALSVQFMGNWRRMWREHPVTRGRYAFFGKEMAILSNGAVTFCHIDYDGRTTMGNITEESLSQILDRPDIRKTEEAFTVGEIVPRGCEHCRGVKHTESDSTTEKEI